MRLITSFIAVLLMLARFLTGAPTGEDNSDLLRYKNVQTENGYRFSYETKDGQAREEVGTIDPATGVMTVTGWYSYRTPDGATHRIDFVADEYGFQATQKPDYGLAVVGESDYQTTPKPAFLPDIPQIAPASAPIDKALLLSLLGG